jgi:hypothetical protein
VKRLRRILLNVATVLSLLLCVATAVFWVRAGSAHDWFVFTTPGDRLWQVSAPEVAERNAIGILTVPGWPVREAQRWRVAEPGAWCVYELFPTPDLNDWRWERLGVRIERGAGVTKVNEGEGAVLARYWTLPDGRVRGRISMVGPGTATSALPYVSATVPYWMPLSAFGLLPVGRGLRRIVGAIRARRRTMRGHCAGCGYDLRATPGRCPECGKRVAL